MSFGRETGNVVSDLQSFPEYARIITHNSSHAVPQDSDKNRTRVFCEKASLCTLLKASFTLEAAVILPLVAAFFVSILFFFRVLQVQTQVQEALYYAGRKTACEASLVSSKTALFASVEAYFRKELEQYEQPERYVKHGTVGISLLGSDVSGSYIDLQANYDVKLPISFFTVNGISISQRCKTRKWTGDREDGELTDYVYVTEHGTVYHRDRECNYLDLTIQTVKSADIAGLHNKNEHKYYACSECVAKNNTPNLVYITDYGTCYHASLSCSGLKRTIYLIPLSEVGGKSACSKCGAAHTE